MPLPGQTLGEVEVISTDPAVGVELAYTSDGDMIVHNLSFTLVTSAVVANRRPEVVVDDGTNVFFRTQATADQVASATVIYTLTEGHYAAPAPSATRQQLTLPGMGLRLKKGDRIRTLTSALDVGDNYGAMILQVERLGAS